MKVHVHTNDFPKRARPCYALGHEAGFSPSDGTARNANKSFPDVLFQGLRIISSSVPKLITLSYENLLDRVERAWHVTEFLADGVMIGAKLSDQVCVFFYGKKAIVCGELRRNKRKTVMVSPQRTIRLRGKDIGNKNRKKIFYHVVVWIIFKGGRYSRVQGSFAVGGFARDKTKGMNQFMKQCFGGGSSRFETLGFGIHSTGR